MGGNRGTVRKDSIPQRLFLLLNIRKDGSACKNEGGKFSLFEGFVADLFGRFPLGTLGERDGAD